MKVLNSRGGVAGGGDSDGGAGGSGGEGDNGVGGRGRDGERQNGGWRYRHGRFGSGSRPPWSGMTLRQWQALIMAASQNATARCATAGRRERRGSTAIAIDMSLCTVLGSAAARRRRGIYRTHHRPRAAVFSVSQPWTHTHMHAARQYVPQ